MEQIKTMKCQLEGMLQTGLSVGCENVCAEEIHHVAASIKDLAEAMYYCAVTEAMEKKDEPEAYDIYGYHRSPTTGRFVRGYNRPLEHTYIDGYLNDPYFRENMRMGYSGGNGGNSGSSNGGNSGSNGGNSGGSMGYSTNQSMPMNYGYNPQEHMMRDPEREGMNMTRNYDRHGRAYGDWSMARRHYQETQKPEDKEKMNKHALEHVNESVTTLQEMWDHADPEQRKRMKRAIDNLHHAMNE